MYVRGNMPVLNRFVICDPYPRIPIVPFPLFRDSS